jgi:4-hydroxy-tetrahydrodipicolinate synthase
MTISKGVYAAGLSVIREDFSLDIESTIKHAENLIKSGISGVFFFGSTGMSQLLSVKEKKELITKIENHKNKKNFFLGTGNNSLNDNLDIINHGTEKGFNTFLLMPPAYYPKTDTGVYNFYKTIINKNPEIKIILYNFEKLSGYLFSEEAVKKLVNDFPKSVIGCKDSSYNLYEKLKIKNFLMFPGTEAKLLKGLELGCSGIISAVTNVTHNMAKKVFEDFINGNKQTINSKLIKVREIFDNYPLISALHSFLSDKDEKYKMVLPPLTLLDIKKKRELLIELKKLDFIAEKMLGV